MAFPDGWPPRPSSGVRNIAFFVEGTTTTDYADNAYLFIDGVGANPFNPVPYLQYGDEKVHVAVVPGNPLGTGRDARDALPFNPNVFFRGEGLGTSRTTLSVAGTTVTYTDYTKKFTGDMVNKEILVAGATTPAHDGTFRITSVPTEHSITWENPTPGPSEDFPVTGSFRIRVIEEAVVKPMIWASSIRVANIGATDIYISFDGVNDHGLIPAGTTVTYRDRAEAGIALKAAAGSAFYVEAW